jgi:ParB-like chromosome segregation protein Spo0J
VPKPESFPIDKIYVPVKRRKALRPELVRELAESILEKGQKDPILVRSDEDRFVLVEGLHRLEACKALGEGAIIGLLVTADMAPEKPLSPAAEAERQKMERLKKLRLEKEAADKLAMASRAGLQAQATARQREQANKTTQKSPKAASSQPSRGASGAAPRTLSEWIKQQERGGGRY